MCTYIYIYIYIYIYTFPYTYIYIYIYIYIYVHFLILTYIYIYIYIYILVGQPCPRSTAPDRLGGRSRRRLASASFSCRAHARKAKAAVIARQKLPRITCVRRPGGELVVVCAVVGSHSVEGPEPDTVSGVCSVGLDMDGLRASPCTSAEHLRRLECVGMCIRSVRRDWPRLPDKRRIPIMPLNRHDQ